MFPPGADAQRRAPARSAGARAHPARGQPPGTSTRILLEQALAAVNVTPQIAVVTAAREAIVPLVLAGAGAALLPAPSPRSTTAGRDRPPRPPKITRKVGLVHRDGPLSAAARAFLALA